MTGTPGSDLVFINEEFYADAVTPAQLDLLLADAWRHFGTHFFRYNINIYREQIVHVLPLRVRLDNFQLSKSQRRVLKRNADLTIEFAPIAIDDEIEEMFHRHKRRFDHDVPDSIFNFLSRDAANTPTKGFQITVRDRECQLIAVSFFDVGAKSISAIYGCFEPTESSRSLGIFTMLKVIEYASQSGKTFYYHGYAYDVGSFYDYKKRFSAIEEYDWKGDWRAVPT